ncbi:MAG: PAS domain-containing protein, partial [Candidatus Electryoneaceae bacterium]|nr:PAS domain-containing protein [Candidatus Electryoneaceae bacterium]
QDKFEIISRSSLDAIMIIDSNDGTIKKANPAVQQVLGYQVLELIGQNFRILLPVESKFPYEKLSNSLTIHDAVIQTQEFRCADNSISHLDMTASLISWNDRNENAILVTLGRAMERRKENQAIRLNERNGGFSGL